MRDILFKAKRKDNGEWVEGYLFRKYYQELPHDRLVIQYKTRGNEYEWTPKYMAAEIDENTICQYTGLTDKNGNKIWENDIIKYHFGNDVAPIRYGEYQSCFDNTKTGHIGFYVDWNGKQALRKDLGYWVNMIDCNVIGNTIDNPELIGGIA